MPHRNHHELGSIRPLRLFLSVLGVAFAIEAVVMLVLPYLVPPHSSAIFGAIVDAGLLTIVLAPLLWYLIVDPLNRLAAGRFRLLALTLSAQEDERRRIARDLHDSLGQSLTGLMVGLRTMEDSSTEPKVQAQARELRRIGGEAHDEIRRLARGLRPAILDDLGLIPALERYVEDLAAAHQIEIRFESECAEPTRLPDDVASSIFRIVQEATTNSIRHGQAKHVQLHLACDAHEIRMTIGDDGCGFNPHEALKVSATNNPFGLLSIQERACWLGGAAVITSHPGAGTQINVRIPWKPAEAAHD